jgi:predicted  nucleic acid-binding Zn-ribbon protein
MEARVRTLAAYSFSAVNLSGVDVSNTVQEIENLLAVWLKSKGSFDENINKLKTKDGRIADIIKSTIKSKSGCLFKTTIIEPVKEGLFETTLYIGHAVDKIHIMCLLRAGQSSGKYSPVFFSPNCPQIIRSIIKCRSDWKSSETPITNTYKVYNTKEEGKKLASLLKDTNRSIPIIAISNQNGLFLHPKIGDEISRELIGLATVCVLEGQSSWALSNELGREWSCYNGAIRLYWPFTESNRAPLKHPLWTDTRLMKYANDTRDALDKLKNQLKRKIFSVSALSTVTPDLFDQIHASYNNENKISADKLIEEHKNINELAQSYAVDVEKLKLEKSQLRDQIRLLRQQLYTLQLQNAWQNDDPEDIEPDIENPPKTVREAYKRAKRYFAETLIFGSDVEEGIDTLVENAGPPDKIYDYLEFLSEMTREKRNRSLGMSEIQWLKEFGCNCSLESETVKKCRQEMNKRIWNDGRETRQFEMHLKPNEATAPNKCVRIYFDWDEASEMTVIGWIGRHP